ncbi:MAG: hypothetical protein Q4B42_07100, partial [Oscillospiraceae bacterium]|nr:hypothetical protein [Oscillospiraceae bacterium]
MKLDYTRRTGRLENPARFAALESFLEESGLSNPALEGFPKGSAYLYRAAGLHGSCSYWRLNSCFYLFCPRFENEAEAQSYLEKTGLAEIANESVGTVLLLSPRGKSWSADDLDSLCRLQRAALENLGDICGSYCYNYYIGIDTGASFLHDFVSHFPECSARAAGALALGGVQTRRGGGEFYERVTPMPVWLEGVSEETLREYLRLAGLQNAEPETENGLRIYKSAAEPLMSVVLNKNGGGDLKALIRRAYDNFLKKRMRLPLEPGRSSLLDSPYCSLWERHTPEELGLEVISHEDGEPIPGTEIYRWYEYLPENTSGKMIPLLLALHGHCDDPRAFVEQCGFLELAGRERLALIAPEHQYIEEATMDDADSTLGKPAMLARAAEYMLQKYPFLD